MTNSQKPTHETGVEGRESVGQSAELEADEARVVEILEKARQSVKPLMKAELAGEVISGDLLNFRLRLQR
jgi:hypothetical protein